MHTMCQKNQPTDDDKGSFTDRMHRNYSIAYVILCMIWKRLRCGGTNEFPSRGVYKSRCLIPSQHSEHRPARYSRGQNCTRGLCTDPLACSSTVYMSILYKNNNKYEYTKATPYNLICYAVAQSLTFIEA